MASEYPHIFLRDSQETSAFTTPRRRGEQNIPSRNRESHGAKLQEQWAAIWAKAKEEEESRSAVSMPAKDGVYVEFEGAPGYELATKSLEDRRLGIRLLTVYTVPSESDPEQEITRATVFVPAGKQTSFLKKLEAYAREETRAGKPKHEALIQSVEDVRLAFLESLWRDDIELMPQETSSAWCEIWLHYTEETKSPVENQFRECAESLGIEIQDRVLYFPDRMVLLGKAMRGQLATLLDVSSNVAEFRRAKETSRFFLELQNIEQTEWVEDLLSRLTPCLDAKVAVCVLDSGANNGHVLLAPVLADSDCHAVEPDWGVNDDSGHGTLMCGLAAFGDLLELLQHNGPITLRHCLESAKILPPNGENEPDLYGDITIQAVARAEVQEPERSHIGCMAVTSVDGRDRGRPSSWSAAIDMFTSGYQDDNKRLFIVSAGNCEDFEGWKGYPKSNQSDSIHDPGQSWNALTVGAYTEKIQLTDPDLEGHKPLAQPGELSPLSTTSCEWDAKWPIKPDIILEGGNLAKGPDGFISEHDDLSLLSTGHEPTKRQFDAINATSAAAAQAARMAAEIQARYPDAWPETVRALMVHSAEWPDALKKQFLQGSGGGEYSKTDYRKLLRVCGYGVTKLRNAIACASNSLTLIAQAELQPYFKREGRSDCSTKDMHLHRIPWPKDLLLSLGEMSVSLRITLSYFIEPGPGEVGWKDKYRYASCALRFDLNNTGEDEESFVRRLNAAAREDGERPDSDSGSQRWRIGSKSRNTGSIHSDIWEGTAAEIASCNLIGVYPIIGWWRERKWLNRWDRKIRYSLIVSLRTQEEEVDIYTPVAIQLDIPVEVIV